MLGHRVALHAQTCGSLVHQVYGLVGQESLGDVAVREAHGGYDGIVLYAHTVVLLVALLQSSQDADAGRHIGLVHLYRLETALQSLVLLEILLVLVQRGGTNAAQFATSQCRLQNVGGIHGTLCLSGTHEGVYLVYKEDYLALALCHLGDDTLQTFLELALVLGTGNESAHVQGVNLFALEVLGHIATEDTVCQALHDGGLARTGFANEDGVVLCAAAQYLQHTTDFLVPTNHGVQFAVLGILDQVACKAVESLLLVLLIVHIVLHNCKY